MARILILEDEVDQGDLYRLILEGAGHEVLDVLDNLPPVADSDARLPDVVILDERLGGRSGTGLIPRIQARFPKARILVLTADPDVAQEARRRGANEGKTKPISTADLISGIERLACL